MTTSKQKVEESERIRNLAEAKKFEAEAAKEEFTLYHAKGGYGWVDSKDMYNGYFPFNSDITQLSAFEFCTQLRTMRRHNGIKKPITIEFSSAGGEIDSGFTMYDELLRFQAEGTPITMRVRGEACSMAAIILQACNNREMGPNARLMLHRASFGIVGSSDKVEDAVEEARDIERRFYRLLGERTNLTANQWKGKLGKRKDMWFDADESLKLGLIDAIV